MRKVTPQWGEFLRSPEPTGHAVQIYQDVSELAASVADYLVPGFEAGDPAIVIATAEHRGAFANALAERGWSGADIEEPGLFTSLEAAETLAAFMHDGRPSKERFEHVVGGVIDSVSDRFPGRTIRAFGEMVDILCQRGDPASALELERLWNELARNRSFALLCGYQLDLFDRHAQISPLPGVCDTHTHVLPATDVTQLTRAVDFALENVLGPARTVNVYLSAQRQLKVDAPLPQLALMWVSAQMPGEADRVLSLARERYTAGSVAALA